MSYHVYILYSPAFDQYYIGQTRDLGKRFTRHNARLEPSSSRYAPWTVIWSTQKPDRSEAMALERKLKNLSRGRLKLFLDKYK